MPTSPKRYINLTLQNQSLGKDGISRSSDKYKSSIIARWHNSSSSQWYIAYQKTANARISSPRCYTLQHSGVYLRSDAQNASQLAKILWGRSCSFFADRPPQQQYSHAHHYRNTTGACRERCYVSPTHYDGVYLNWLSRKSKKKTVLYMAVSPMRVIMVNSRHGPCLSNFKTCQGAVHYQSATAPISWHNRWPRPRYSYAITIGISLVRGRAAHPHV